MHFTILILLITKILCANVNFQVKKYQFIELIGSGAFGKILLYKDRVSNKFIALKAIPAYHRRIVGKEWDICKNLKFPFIIKSHSVFRDSKHYYIAMDYVSQNTLTHLIHYFSPLEINYIKFIGRQLFLAIKHLHSMGIGHRDIKPSNIMIDHEGNLVLIDFGLSKRFEKSSGYSGTVGYMSIDILKLMDNQEESKDEKPFYTKAVDFWSFGVIIYKLRTKRFPHPGASGFQTLQFIKENNVDFDEIKDDVTVDFIKKLLHLDPKQRLMTGVDIESHDWFKGTDWDYVLMKLDNSPILDHILLLKMFKESSKKNI